MRLILALCLSALLSSCAATGAGSDQPNASQNGELSLVHGGSQCGSNGAEPRVTWVDDAVSFKRIIVRANAKSGRERAVPGMDFQQHGVVWISMGDKPSAGYRINSDGSTFIQDEALNVPVDWAEPAPGYVQAQVLTSPCLLIAVPRGNFTAINVIDQNGKTRISSAP